MSSKKSRFESVEAFCDALRAACAEPPGVPAARDDVGQQEALLARDGVDPGMPTSLASPGQDWSYEVDPYDAHPHAGASSPLAPWPPAPPQTSLETGAEEANESGYRTGAVATGGAALILTLKSLTKYQWGVIVGIGFPAGLIVMLVFILVMENRPSDRGSPQTVPSPTADSPPIATVEPSPPGTSPTETAAPQASVTPAASQRPAASAVMAPPAPELMERAKAGTKSIPAWLQPGGGVKKKPIVGGPVIFDAPLD